MFCDFQLLYYGEYGYIGRCKNCGYYQVAFISTLLTLTPADFSTLIKMVRCKFEEADHAHLDYSKSIIIPTPAPDICLFLSRKETVHFLESLEAADTEAKALSLINMFNAKN